MATEKSPFVILRGVAHGNRFFSCNNGSDPTKLTDGTVGYTILGYADTVEEAQIALFGRSYTECKECHTVIGRHKSSCKSAGGSLTPEFLEKLRSTKSSQEWSNLVQPMLAETKGNNYPPDWWEKVMASGLASEAEKNWIK